MDFKKQLNVTQPQHSSLPKTDIMLRRFCLPILEHIQLIVMARWEAIDCVIQLLQLTFGSAELGQELTIFAVIASCSSLSFLSYFSLLILEVRCEITRERNMIDNRR